MSAVERQSSLEPRVDLPPTRRPVFFADRYAAVRLVVRISELGVLALGGVLAYWLRNGIDAVPPDYCIAITFAVATAAIGSAAAGLDVPLNQMRFLHRLARVVALWLAALGVLATTIFLLKKSDDFSRLWLYYWLFTSIPLLALTYSAIRHRTRRMVADGRLMRRLVVIGSGPEAASIAERLPLLGLGATVVAFFSPPISESGPTIDAFVARLRNLIVDEIVVVMQFETPARLAALLRGLAELPVDVQLCPGRLDLEPYTSCFGTDLLLFPVLRRPLQGYSHFVKLCFDKLGALLLLFLLGPLILLIGALIKLDSPGPSIYVQQRYGFNDAPIRVLKFRTMREDATDDGALQAVRGDPRITKLGRFLRRTSIDELPQLLNVLRGDMSLVGPRPHSVPHNLFYRDIVAAYGARHRIRPGITGWAQVNGCRGNTQTVELMRRRVEYDLAYMANWSLMFDVKILLLTAFGRQAHRNAE
jgi:putative colanic acid biosysnthesis UDP-glucose lipid carrier transferase